MPNKDVESLKRSVWTSGNHGSVAGGLDDKARSDKHQVPHSRASSRSDVFGLGCVILKWLRIPLSRYRARCLELLDLDLDSPYEYYPYSRELVKLAQKCVHLNLRERPDPLELYKITQHYAALYYSPVHLTQPVDTGTAYQGQTLWSNDMQGYFSRHRSFRWDYSQKNDCLC